MTLALLDLKPFRRSCFYYLVLVGRQFSIFEASEPKIMAYKFGICEGLQWYSQRILNHSNCKSITLLLINRPDKEAKLTLDIVIYVVLLITYKSAKFHNIA